MTENWKKKRQMEMGRKYGVKTQHADNVSDSQSANCDWQNIWIRMGDEEDEGGGREV